jgi:hypothetical protein
LKEQVEHLQMQKCPLTFEIIKIHHLNLRFDYKSFVFKRHTTCEERVGQSFFGLCAARAERYFLHSKDLQAFNLELTLHEH